MINNRGTKNKEYTVILGVKYSSTSMLKFKVFIQIVLALSTDNFNCK